MTKQQFKKMFDNYSSLFIYKPQINKESREVVIEEWEVVVKDAEELALYCKTAHKRLVHARFCVLDITNYGGYFLTKQKALKYAIRRLQSIKESEMQKIDTAIENLQGMFKKGA